jgi:hypothetical protein
LIENHIRAVENLLGQQLLGYPYNAGLIPFAVKNLLNTERDILTAPLAGGGPTKSHQLAFRNPLH